MRGGTYLFERVFAEIWDIDYDSFIDRMDSHLLTCYEKEKPKTIPPSSLGGCLRALFYTLTEPPRPHPRAMLRKLVDGRVRHERLLSLWKDMGILVASEIKLEVVDFCNGRLDAIVRVEEQEKIVEIKGYNDSLFKRAKKEEGLFADKIQLAYYMSRLEKPGMLFYENKNDQSQFTVNLGLTSPFLAIALKRLADINRCLREKVLPKGEKSRLCYVCVWRGFCSEQEGKK